MYFIPHDDAGRELWISNFANKLGTYATKYGITATEVTDTQNGAAWFRYWLDYKNKYQEYTKKVTDFKNQIIKGVPSGAVAAITPTPPVLPVPPTAVNPDVFGRASSIAARIKGFQSYTPADGLDLGIVGNQTVLDLVNIQPKFSIRLVAGKPEIVWAKQNMSGIEIYKSTGEAPDYVFLAFDSNPNYTDNSPLPAQGKSAVWKYKIIYKYKDEQVGKWSDEISITVTGAI
jgi:hypothetical protein